MNKSFHQVFSNETYNQSMMDLGMEESGEI